MSSSTGMRDPFSLAGRTAIVTGGGHGIGTVYCQALSAQGAAVVVADIDYAAANRAALRIADAGGKSCAVHVDVSDERSVVQMADSAQSAFGPIHILVNNAALFATVPISRGGFDAIDPAEWDRVMAVNVKGTWLATRAVAPSMRENKYGKIINISSGTALKGAAGRIHYVASKAAVLGLTRTLAAELGGDNICVNAIAPGNTLSEENASAETVAMRERAVGSRVLKRVELPDDLVGAVLFLAAPASDFITGQTLVVDGGSVMH